MKLHTYQCKAEANLDRVLNLTQQPCSLLSPCIPSSTRASMEGYYSEPSDRPQLDMSRSPQRESRPWSPGSSVHRDTPSPPRGYYPPTRERRIDTEGAGQGYVSSEEYRMHGEGRAVDDRRSEEMQVGQREPGEGGSGSGNRIIPLDELDDQNDPPWWKNKTVPVEESTEPPWWKSRQPEEADAASLTAWVCEWTKCGRKWKDQEGMVKHLHDGE
jgi:hypothetical protein